MDRLRRGEADKGPKEDVPGREGELEEERTGPCWELQVITKNSACVPNTLASSGVTQSKKQGPCLQGIYSKR